MTIARSRLSLRARVPPSSRLARAGRWGCDQRRRAGRGSAGPLAPVVGVDHHCPDLAGYQLGRRRPDAWRSLGVVRVVARDESAVAWGRRTRPRGRPGPVCLSLKQPRRPGPREDVIRAENQPEPARLIGGYEG